MNRFSKYLYNKGFDYNDIRQTYIMIWFFVVYISLEIAKYFFR